MHQIEFSKLNIQKLRAGGQVKDRLRMRLQILSAAEEIAADRHFWFAFGFQTFSVVSYSSAHALPSLPTLTGALQPKRHSFFSESSRISRQAICQRNAGERTQLDVVSMNSTEFNEFDEFTELFQ